MTKDQGVEAKAKSTIVLSSRLPSLISCFSTLCLSTTLLGMLMIIKVEFRFKFKISKCCMYRGLWLVVYRSRGWRHSDFFRSVTWQQPGFPHETQRNADDNVSFLSDVFFHSYTLAPKISVFPFFSSYSFSLIPILYTCFLHNLFYPSPSPFLLPFTFHSHFSFLRPHSPLV